MSNETDGELRLGVQVAVGDPAKADYTAAKSPLMKSKGSFAEASITVNPHANSSIRLPYTLPPDAGSNPLLVFRLFEPTEKIAPGMARRFGLTKADMRHWRDTRLVHWGRFDLRKAVEKGLASLPPSEPVEERIKLTGERRSKHFVFRYRPNSYAAINIDKAI